METLIPQRKRLAGFSLVEMAIVILIAGIMMSAGLSLLSVKQDAAKWDATRKNQEVIKQALINYLGKNKRLPCPATVANGGAPATPPPCASYSGIVPYYELGLDRATVLDGWESFITYVVSTNPITSPPPSPYTTAWLFSYSTSSNISPNTTTGSSAFWPSTSTGGIKVTNGTTTIADPGNATGAAVVLISYGKNGFGAANVKGGTNSSASAGTDEAINVSLDSSGAAVTVVKRDASDSPAGNAFDDIVMILSANDLTGPLIANGTLQSNAQAALSQANDAVFGNIIASRQYTQKLCSSSLPSPAPQPSSFSTCYTLGLFDAANSYNILFYSLPYSCSTPPVTPIPPTNCSNAGFYANNMTGAWPAAALASGITYTVANQFDCAAPPPLPHPQKPTGCSAGYYYAIDGGSPLYPTLVNLFATPSVSMTGVAYQLTAGDGSTKTVSIQELQGILARAAGFN